MKTHFANRILSGLSAILSLALLLTCIWLLTSIFIKWNEGKDDCRTRYHKTLCEETSTSSTPASFEDEEPVVIDNEDIMKPEARSLEVWTKFDEMTPHFRMVIIGCISAVVFATLVQLICSFILMCSPAHKMPSRSRRIVYILFVVFIILMAGIGWPMAYKRQYVIDDESGDEFHTIPTFSSASMKFMDTFEWKKLLTDFYLYYIQVFVNILYLFIHMVTSCCLLRFSYYEDYDI